MRTVVAAIVPFLLAAISAAAEEKPRWIGGTSDGGASLVYGVPQSGYGPLSFSCRRKGQALSFSFDHEPIQAKSGVKVSVLLSANGIEIRIPTVGKRLEMDDLFVLEGRVRLDDRLRKLLTSGGTLEVWVEDGSAEFPLSGAAEAGRALFERCG